MEDIDNRPLVRDEAKIVAKQRKRRVIGSIIGLILIAVVVVIIIFATKNKDPQPTPPPTPDNPLNFQEFNPFRLSTTDFLSSVWFYNGILNFQKSSTEQMADSFLRLQQGDGDQPQYKPIDPKRIPTGLNNEAAEKVAFNISLINNFQARIQIGAVDGDNYTVPNETIPRSVQEFEARFEQVGLQVSGGDEPFSFSFKNSFNGEDILTTKNRKFVVQNKYSEIGMVLPTSRLFGLGNGNRRFRLQTDRTYTLFSRGWDNTTIPKDDGMGSPHGSQVMPFILGQTKNTDKNDWFGLFFVGGGPQTFELVSVTGSDQVILNYITLSDTIEFNMIMRGSAFDIIQRFQHDLFFPSMPPYFALGTFVGSQSNRWASKDVVLGDLGEMTAINLPIDGVLIDGYTQNQLVPFTQDSKSFNFQTFVSDMRKQNIKVLLGVQSQLPSDPALNPFISKAQDNKCLLNQTHEGSTIADWTVGKFKPIYASDTQEPVDVSFVDPFSEGATAFYQEALTQLAGISGGWDGLVLRGNSPYFNSNGSRFADKQEEQTKRRLADVDPENKGNYEGYQIGTDQAKASFVNLPFSPAYDGQGPLDTSSLDMGLVHSGFAKDENPHAKGVPEFYVHNLNGLRQHQIFNQILMKTQTQRTNIYSESAWPGTGYIGGSFSQQLSLEWESLPTLVSMAMNMGLAGINSWVTEACGSQQDDWIKLKSNAEAVELCTRWFQIASFLPMVRLQGEFVEIFAEDQITFKSLQESMYQRLPFTRYIYSQMFAANYTGGSVVYPLLFDNPSDGEALNNIEETYMLGDSLKISPVLDSSKGKTTFRSYFPEGLWYDIFNFSSFINATGQGQYFDLDRKANQTQVHLKPGKLIPFQPALTTKRETTGDFEYKKVSLIINRDESHYADGYVLVDDGITQSNFAKNQYTYWKIRVGETAINFWVERGDFEFDVYQQGKRLVDQLDEIHILHASELKDVDHACYLGINLQPKNMTFAFDEASQVLTIKPAADDLNVTFRDIGFIKFGNSQKEPNICNPDGFKYFGEELTDLKNQTFKAFKLQPASGSTVLQPLYATALLMDDEGSINLNITTESDWNSKFTELFRVPNVQDQSLFPQEKVTKSIDDFLTFTVAKDQPFSYQLHLFQDPTHPLLTSDPSKLFVSPYLVFDNAIFNMNQANGNPLMGMGERAGELFYKNEKAGVHSRWTHDGANPIDDGLPPGRNMYGFQPTYYFQSSIQNKWVSVFNNNPYATDFIVSTNEGVNAEITTVTIGGLIEKYFFIGDKPDDVIRKYSKLTGNPQMQPMWAFGWQQCKFGWVTDTHWKWVVEQYEKFKIPLDTMWADIDYMDNYKIFTISQDTYSHLPEYVDEIRKKNMTFVPIMDVAVPNLRNTNYYALERGLEMDVFIKQALSDAPLTAGVWGNQDYWPDFFHPNATAYWMEMWDYMTDHYGLQFDGIWIDMNEASTHCTGYMIESERPKKTLRNIAYYIPGQRDLEEVSLGVDGRHYNGFREYDMHNTFSLFQVKATAEYLIKKGKRPFVLSRSNYPGLQKYGFHWIGDNWSTVEYMVDSVLNTYEYNLFALPFMGSDLCGFNGDATPELCTRWHQLGNLFPFARNHEQNASKPQEPFRFNETYKGDVTFTDLIRTAISNRYSLIRFFYSSFFDISLFGGSFFKPLFFEYPEDPNAYIDIARNIMLGSALKVSIEVTRLGDGDSQFYFPKGTWCQLLPFVHASYSDNCFSTDGTLANSNLTMRANLEDYYVHQASGSIVPIQNATVYKTMNTKEQLDQPIDLFVNPNSVDGKLSTFESSNDHAAAVGFVIYDDGVTTSTDYTRFDIYYSHDAANPTTVAQLTLVDVSKTKYKAGTRSEQIGVITVFNPFSDAKGSARQVDSVFVTLTDKTDIDITNQAYFVEGPESQTLHLGMEDLRQKPLVLNFRFDEVSSVTIKYKQ